MSRQVRYRVAAVVVSGLIFGAPLLTNGTASAEQLDPNDRRVIFSGDGVLGLTCESKPSVESMTVPPDSVVKVQNRTGHDARLELGGVERGTVPQDGSADLVFRRGTTSVVLTPECDNGDDAIPMIVTAEPSAPAGRPDPPQAQPGSGVATLVRPPASRPSIRTPAGSLRSGLAPTAQRPVRTGTRLSRPGTRRTSVERPQAAMSDPGAMPQRDAGQDSRRGSARGTGGVGAPAVTGLLPGEQRALPPRPSPSSPSPAAADALPGSTAGVAPEPAGVPTAVAQSSGMAEPFASVGPIREGRPIGLLGITAIVCVLGVSIAAIRAFVSQRASRANMS